MKPLNVVVSTPSAVVAAGLAALLQRMRASGVGEVRVVEPAGLEGALAKQPARLLLLDPLTAGGQRVAALRELLPPEAAVVAVATGQLPAEAARAFDQVMSVYDSPAALADIIDRANAAPGDADESRTLSQREREVVVAIVKGLSNKEIAAEMGVSVNTVMTHRRNISSKLQIHSAAGLTIYAIMSKLVSLDEIATRRL